MFNFFNKADAEVRQDVLNELCWDPSITSEDLKVSAKEGIVTLTGNVPHYIEKIWAEKAAQRVGGVKAVADEIKVRGLFDKSDEEIAHAALSALKWNYSAPDDVKIVVDKGWITLSGNVEWEYQRTSAVDAVNGLLGVCGVKNNMKIKVKTQPTDIKKSIQAALQRSAETEGKNIVVTIKGNKVILSGHVQSAAESEDAALASWNAPGVMHVENNLVITR